IRSASWSAGNRPPSAAVIGSPVERIRKKTVVTRMKIVGKISRKRMSRYVPSPPPPRGRAAGAPPAGSVEPAVSSVVVMVISVALRATSSLLGRAARGCSLVPYEDARSAPSQEPRGTPVLRVPRGEVRCRSVSGDRSALGQDAVPEFEGRVQRVLRPLDVLADDGDLGALQVGDGGQVLGLLRLDLLDHL